MRLSVRALPGKVYLDLFRFSVRALPGDVY